jgi:hypothetical protein
MGAVVGASRQRQQRRQGAAAQKLVRLLPSIRPMAPAWLPRGSLEGYKELCIESRYV